MEDDQTTLALANIRRDRGISLQAIAESTKISVRSLEAIERGEFKKLPGGIYNTNYIRQYARAIDYDESLLLAVYYRETGQGNLSPSRPNGRNGKSFFGDYRPVSI